MSYLDLDLIVGPTYDINGSIIPPPTQISRLVHFGSVLVSLWTFEMLVC